MSPLLGGHLHLARDSLIGEDEEITPLLKLSRGLDLGDFVSTAPVPPHCLRRSVGMTSFIFAPGTKSRSPSPGLRACSSRAAVSPSSPLLSSRIRRSGAATGTGTSRPNQSPHFWQPWSAREVTKSPMVPQSPREAKHSGRSAIRGRSPRSPTAGHSPKSSPSPETSRSPPRMALPQRRSRGGVGSPRAASPFNPHTDYDIPLDLPIGRWHRFETRVGIADESKWPSATRAKFQLIDEDDKTLLWESTESLELWAPTELCSVLMAERSPEKTNGLKHLCLRVRCSAIPFGALWIDPVLTEKRPEKRPRGPAGADPVVEKKSRLGPLFQEMFASELLMELVCRLSCCDVARLLTACRHGLQSQQAAWHCAFAHSFKQAYLRYFLGPLRKPTGLNGTAIQWLGGAQNGNFTFAPYGRANDAVVTPRPSGPLTRGSPPGPAAIPPTVGATTWRQSGLKGGAQMVVCCQSCRMAPETSQLPPWATELFDWRQICRRFHLAQLPYANVNFQLFNCSTPNGFVKDSGETLHVPRAFHGQSPNFRCGWNIPLGAVHFQSQPSAVVAHRSPLGVAGVPPSVATVRGTAGPEPMAMTPVISEKDSAVILPAWPQQPRLQWTLEVDPGRYLVVVTVGDRHVGFAAHLEVNGWPVFSGEWVESGTFKSRCLICETRHGAITLGQLAREKGLHKDELCHQSRLAASDGLLETLAPPGSSAASDPPDPPRSPRPRGTGVLTDALAKGTRLVSIRIAAVALAREVEKERKASFGDLTAKISDARLRLDSLRQALETSPNTQLEREMHRVFAKLSELQAQKALKLFSFLASARRVTHPYIYLSGEATANP